ncbi:MAG TPA: dihydrolipoyllysine-residue acetyltransferase [Propionibacteriaceae bacterium]|nr:dihydrolipoyllysine-residue acetyltransferase [Propionibacteriaceae bacterium]
MATQVAVPDIGDFNDVPVIEVHVAAGDVVAVDDPLVTLESDKATMDVPSTAAGEIRELFVKEGDRVSEGTPLVAVEESGAAEAEPPTMIGQQEPTPAAAAPAAPVPEVAAPAVQPAGAPTAPAAAEPAPSSDFLGVHAGPSVRRLARELGVELSSVNGTGPKGRITKEDLLQNLRGPAAPAAAPAEAPSGMGIPPIPAVDFSKFGPTEVEPLPRIKKISGPFLHRSWLNIPHVTHGDEADITELDAYRKELDTAAKAEGYRVTLLAFLLKASVSALQAYPTVNSSLTPEGDSLILKKYINIGVAVDTPDGLVVPVITDVDRKGITELSKDLGAVSAKARDGKLGPSDLQGGTFTISSLGGIGGTNFTPIVNAPEVAILGVVRSKRAPVWDGEQFVPRMMLPVFLSYDHRVIDGALAARFMRHLCDALSDMRRLLL